MCRTEGARELDRQLFEHVCDVLDRAGFLMRDGDRGLMVALSSRGVQVRWRPGHALLGPVINNACVDDDTVPDGAYGQGIKAAMTTAVASVLEQAGYCVDIQGTDLFVTRVFDTRTFDEKPPTSLPVLDGSTATRQ